MVHRNPPDRRPLWSCRRKSTARKGETEDKEEEEEEKDKLEIEEPSLLTKVPHLVAKLDKLEDGFVALLAALTRYDGHLCLAQHVRGGTLMLCCAVTSHEGIHAHELILMLKASRVRQADGANLI